MPRPLTAPPRVRRRPPKFRCLELLAAFLRRGGSAAMELGQGRRRRLPRRWRWPRGGGRRGRSAVCGASAQSPQRGPRTQAIGRRSRRRRPRTQRLERIPRGDWPSPRKGRPADITLPHRRRRSAQARSPAVRLPAAPPRGAHDPRRAAARPPASPQLGGTVTQPFGQRRGTSLRRAGCNGGQCGAHRGESSEPWHARLTEGRTPSRNSEGDKGQRSAGVARAEIRPAGGQAELEALVAERAPGAS